jgi:hypothetical protein
MHTSHEESTDALLVRSEENERSVLETVIYALFILSAVAAIFQFAQQPLVSPARSPQGKRCIACVTPANPALPHI